ncbi:hypothetical protein ABIB42_002267 [Massilia sp. UYP32]|uniref:DUF2442 domain-containing protein n=1 Tax=Massilia sp. UYP32 TaxID=1756386 RepID=UPI003D1C0B32
MTAIEFVNDATYAELKAQSDVNNAQPKRFRSIRYDEKRKNIALGLANGMEIALPVSAISELVDVPVRQLRELRLSLSGEAIVLSSADVHMSTGGLLRDIVRMLPREFISAQFAASGGARTSAAKTAASAANGKLGGRPKKSSAAA